MRRNSQAYAVVLIEKTCSHCGARFGAFGKEYKCRACRRPASRPRVNVDAALSFRERQIARMLANAKGNKEIAYELCLTHGTVKEYIHHIFRKLRVSNRTAVALRVIADPEIVAEGSCTSTN